MRIGIFGGAFDPIHNGHLALAHASMEELKLDQIFFVPSSQPPLKTLERESASAELRFQMVKESIKGISKFEISDVELKRKGVSYTIDTIREFRKQFPQPLELFVIVGSDWGNRLHEWKAIDEIFSLSQFVVAARPGFQKMKLPKPIQFLYFEPIDISATKLRQMIRDQKSVSAWIPKPALDLIKKHGLYRN